MKKLTKTDLLWLVCFLAGFAMILYKCPFGFAHMDESFYLTIPYRMVQGDALLLHEWHLSQLPSFLLYPFVKIYLALTGSTEGILLAARYLFTLVQGITAVYVYGKLRSHRFAACCASLLYLFFAHNAIMALSYHSMGIAFLVLTCLLLYGQRRRHTCFLAGIFFAGAVLCCPYLVLVYLLYALGCLAFCRRVPGLGKDLLAFTLACALCGILYLGGILLGCSLSQLLQVIPLILYDPEHPAYSFISICISYLKTLSYHAPIALPALGLAAALFAAIRLDRGRSKREGFYLLLAAAVTALYASQFLLYSDHLNFTMFPLSFLGVFCFALRPREFLREMVLLWVPGIAFGFCLNWTSNQGFFVIANAGLLSSIASMLMAWKLSRSLKPPALPALVAAMMALTVLWAGARRYENLFWEWSGSMEHMTAQITLGAQKGIRTTPERRDAYEAEFLATAPVRNAPGNTVLYYTDSVWNYLDDTKTSASFSGWTSSLDAVAADKLIAYYGVNPDKRPDIAWCTKAALESSPNLHAYLEDLGYTRTETDTACIYTR